MRDTFSDLHPFVCMVYFVMVIGFSVFLIHPICLGISLVCAFTWAVYAGGKKTLKFTSFFMLPTLIVTALLNPAFNHQGATILSYLPDGNPLTLESIIFGLVAAIMLICVVNWFSCYNRVMTSDKFIYLFGRIIPMLSLIISMSLRFVPRFKARMRIISNAQKCVGRDFSTGSILKRARQGIRILSIMITWALENAIETADSMRSRGFGLEGRTAFSLFRFDRRDLYVLIFTIVCGVYIIIGIFLGGLYFRYFPTIKGVETEWFSLSLYAIYFALCAAPIYINIREDLKWKRIQSKN